MRVFLWAVAAMIVISVAAGYILISQEDTLQSTQVTDDVRLK